MIRLAAVVDSRQALTDEVLLPRFRLGSEGGRRDSVALFSGGSVVLGAKPCGGAGVLAEPARPLSATPEVTVVADARLDNRVELLKALAGDTRAPVSDADLIGFAYRRWGRALIAHVEGDYAFVLWDVVNSRLVAGRDGCGVRPLFYAQQGNRLWIASEAAQLLTIDGLSLDLDDSSVLDFVTRDYHQLDCSMFRGVLRVRPGHALVFQNGQLEQLAIWHPRHEIGKAPATDSAAALRQALTHSTESRLESPGPVAIHLSGGLDSSFIACLADSICASSQRAQRRAFTVSAAFPGSPCDESPHIDIVVRSFRELASERWNGRDMDWSDFDDPDIAWPGAHVMFAGGSTGDLQIMLRKGARVLISGEGGDEVCSDHEVQRELALAGRWCELLDDTILSRGRPLKVRVNELLRALAQRAPRFVREARARRSIGNTCLPMWIAPRLRRLWTERVAANWALSERRDSSAAEVIADSLASPAAAQVIEAEQRYASFAGAEMRFPFLAREVIRVALSVPASDRRARGRRRSFQRNAMRGVVPAEVLARDKLVFNSERVWQGIRTAPRLRKMMRESQWLCEPYAPRRGVSALLDDLERRKGLPEDAPDWNAVMRIGTLEAWLRRRDYCRA